MGVHLCGLRLMLDAECCLLSVLDGVVGVALLSFVVCLMVRVGRGSLVSAGVAELVEASSLCTCLYCSLCGRVCPCVRLSLWA